MPVLCGMGTDRLDSTARTGLTWKEVSCAMPVPVLVPVLISAPHFVTAHSALRSVMLGYGRMICALTLTGLCFPSRYVMRRMSTGEHWRTLTNTNNTTTASHRHRIALSTYKCWTKWALNNSLSHCVISHSKVYIYLIRFCLFRVKSCEHSFCFVIPSLILSISHSFGRFGRTSNLLKSAKTKSSSERRDRRRKV